MLALDVDRLHIKDLCQEHFSANCFMNHHKKRLTPTAVPYRYDAPSEEEPSTSTGKKFIQTLYYRYIGLSLHLWYNRLIGAVF